MLHHWLTWALLSAVFAAATAVLSKTGLRGVDADAAQAVRTAVVLLAVLALIATSGGWRAIPQFTVQTWLLLVLAGLATAASWVCYFRALAAGPASRVAAIDKLSVPLVAIFAALFLAERLGFQGWLGVMLMAAGAVLVTLAK
jgi:transporter family protein